MSCIDGSCLPSCDPPRTCTIGADAGCITCGTTTTCSTLSGCIGGPTGSAQIESATCDQWPDGAPISGSLVTFTAANSSECGKDLSREGGVFVGRLTTLDDFSTLAVFPGFGGGCLVTVHAWTGASRTTISCPRCEFVLLFP